MAIATLYFRDFFGTSNPIELDRTLRNVKSTITDDMNDELTRSVTEAEVRMALFAMHPEKAPGPYGMTALFYQWFWDIVKEDVARMVNDF